MTEYDTIARMMVADAKVSLRNFRQRIRQVEIGTEVVDFDFFTSGLGDQRDRDAANDRWCVILAKWDGQIFARTRRVSTPLSYELAIKMSRSKAKRLGLPTADMIRGWADGRDTGWAP